MYVKYNDIVASGVQNVSVVLFDLPKPMVFTGVQSNTVKFVHSSTFQNL